MTQPNKYTNKMRDPSPAILSNFIPSSSTNIKMGMNNDGDGSFIWVRALNAANDKFVSFSVGKMQPGSYVYAAQVVCEDSDLNVLRVVGTPEGGSIREFASARYSNGPGVYTVPFELTVPTDVTLRIMCPQQAGKAANYRRFLLMTAADYEGMKHANVSWFSGSQYLTGGVLRPS